MCLTHRENQPVQDELRQEILDLKFGKHYEDICGYVDPTEITNIKCNVNDLTVMNLNIRGLQSKQLELSKLLKQCLGTKKVDVIILIETWLTTQNVCNIKIPGYKFEGKHRPNKKGVGLVFLSAMN